MSMLQVALDPSTVVVAVDPGKVMNRVWVSNGAGLLHDPVSLPVSRSGIAALEKMLTGHRGEPVIANAQLRPAQRRVARPRHAPDPGPGRARPQRLPT